ncbi:DUF2505 domain-containing protein [Mycolicibacterium moriokaense]|nr:DUF2505 domain-containing protein [Mycolicibacterium moriokaense]
MARSIRVQIPSQVEADNVLAAFGDTAYWEARLAAFSNGTGTLDALHVDTRGTVTVTITLHLLTDRLPKALRRLCPSDVQMERHEQWTPGPDGLVLGDLAATMRGAPVSMTAEARIVATAPGSRLDYVATIDARVPLVGSRIESYLAAQASKEVGAIHRFTGDWITANV